MTGSRGHEADTGGLVRALGGFDATCVVVGAIIGVGIFFTPSSVAAIAGSPGAVLLAWTLGAAIALLGAMTFATLGRMYPNTAGQYEVLRDAYGPLTAFLYVFCNATAIQAGAIAVIAAICAEHAALAVTGTEISTVGLALIAAALIIGLAAANIIGLKYGSTVQNITTVFKVVTLLTIIALALTEGPGRAAHSAPVADDARGGFDLIGMVCAAMVPAFFAFGGWQHALWIAGEVRNPQRNLPVAIIGGVVLVAVVYVAANWAYLHLLGIDGVTTSRTLAADAVAVAWGATGQRIVAVAVAISAFGVLNAQLLSGPRLVYGMARDGRFFKVFASTHRSRHTPVAAILMLSGLGLLLLLIAGKTTSDKLVTGVVMIDSVFFALTALALIVLRRRNPGHWPRPWGYPWIPAAFVVGEIGLVVGSYWESSNRTVALIGAAWIAAGCALYLVRFSAHRAPAQPTVEP